MAIPGSRAWGLPGEDQGRGHGSCRGVRSSSAVKRHLPIPGRLTLRQVGALGTELSVGLQRGTQHAVPGPYWQRAKAQACMQDRVLMPWLLVKGPRQFARCRAAWQPWQISGPIHDSWREGRGHRDSAYDHLQGLCILPWLSRLCSLLLQSPVCSWQFLL